MIEPTQSWALGDPIVTPFKSDSKTLRICNDYRLILNSCLLKQTNDTLTAKNIFNWPDGSKVFSSADLKNA